MQHSLSLWRRVAAIVLALLAGMVVNDVSSLRAEEVAGGEESRVDSRQETPPSDVDVDASTAPVSPSPQPADASAGEAAPPPVPDWEMRPYRVLARITFADRESLDAGFRVRALRTIERRMAGVYGPLWDLTLQDDVSRAALGSMELDRLTAEQLTEQYTSTDWDKVLLVCVERSGAGFELAGCEWDHSSQMLGPVVRGRVSDRRQIPEQISQLLVDLFRPLARIDAADETFAELRVRGGELISPEVPLALIHEGDFLVPVFRYLDRDKSVRQIQSVPWTYLQVEAVNRSRLGCRIESPFPAPISGARRRVELVALQVRPRFPATELTLEPRVPPHSAMVGFRVEVFRERPVAGEEWPEHLSLMSDRRGTVTVPADPTDPLRFLYVFSGDAVLAQTPFLPGVEERATLQLPDDSPRLSVEGALVQIQGDLIDLVARRTVQMARAISLAKRGEDWDSVDQLMTDLGQEPPASQFRSRIIAAREPALAQARRNRDRSAEKRIGKMCRELEELIDKYLDPAKLRDVRIEVEEYRKLVPATKRMSVTR